MESLIISLLVALLGVMQNPQIPLETKAEIYQKTMPVITRYMEETKPVGEIGTGASTEVEEVKKEEESKVIRVGNIIIPKELPKVPNLPK